MKLRLFILTILAGVGFFNPHQILSQQVIKAIYYLCFGASLIYSVYDGVPLSKVKYPRYLWWVLLGGMSVSILMATLFHNQGLITSVMTSVPYIISYMYFLVLLKLEIPPGKIIKVLFVLCSVAVFVYFVNLATFPNNFFGETIEEDLSRGILRIPVIYIHLMVLLIFYSINRWLIGHERKWLLWMGLFMMMVFLSVTRQYILSVAALSALFFMSHMSWAKKITITVAIAGICALVVPQIPVYKAMMEMSEGAEKMQEERGQDNIRVEAWRYYTYGNQTNAITPIFGNGMPAFGHSRWGKMVDSDTELSGLFAFDVGWAGFFYFFGIISTVALFLIMLKALLKKKPRDRQYLSYWIAYTMIISVASAPIMYYWEVLNISIVLYLIYTRCGDGDETSVAKSDVQPEPERRLPKGFF